MATDLSITELLSQLSLLKEEYIKLLNDQDVLINWEKSQLEALYNIRIGVWQLQRLQTQLRIKGLKLKLEQIRSCINQNKPVDITAIELEVAAGLAEAEATILRESAKIEKAHILLGHLETAERSNELRKLFRELAKKLHPDVNTGLTTVQIQLWQLVKEAYENGDLEKLRAMRLVYEKELAAADEGIKQHSPDELTVRINEIIEGIKRLQDNILHTRNQFPFTVEKLVKDDDWVADESRKIKEEIAQLNNYERELSLEYKQLIKIV